MQKIDITKVDPPKVELTKDAASQIYLCLKHDPYVQGKYFRIHISGKGCDGFSFETFFDEPLKDDFKIITRGLTILMAPFTSFYGQKLMVDYILDHENDLEGFVVKHHDQGKFAGKFWRENPELTPDLN